MINGKLFLGLRRTAGAIAVALLLILPSSASAASIHPTNYGGFKWFSGGSTIYYEFVNGSGAAWPTNLKAAINTELGVLNGSRLANLPRFCNYADTSATCRSVATPYATTHLHLRYSNADTVTAAKGHISEPSKVMAVTTNDHFTGGHTIVFREHAMVGSGSSYPYSYCEDVAPYKTSTCYQLATILLHELGHVFALNDYDLAACQAGSDAACTGPGAQYTVMQLKARSSRWAGYNVTTFGSCDSATLQGYYGLSLPANGMSNCMAKPSTKVVLFGTSGTRAGSSVILVAQVMISAVSGLTSNAGLVNKQVLSRPGTMKLYLESGQEVGVMTESPTASGNYMLSTPVLWATTKFIARFTPNTSLPLDYVPPTAQSASFEVTVIQ